MKVCDRHHDKKATETILIVSTDERIDLCDNCAYSLREFIGNPATEVAVPQVLRKRKKK